MNTIIIAIIVIVVLVIILVFFLGGTSVIAQKIKALFTGAIAGTDKQTAIQFCEEYCSTGRYNAWCTQNFKIDWDGDGTPEKVISGADKGKYHKFYCGNPTSADPNEIATKLAVSVGSVCHDVPTSICSTTGLNTL